MGAWRDGSDEQAQDVNPYNQDVLATHAGLDRADVDDAYAAAERAQRAQAAAALPPSAPAQLRRAVDLSTRHDELVAWCQRESGIRAKAEFEAARATSPRRRRRSPRMARRHLRLTRPSARTACTASRWAGGRLPAPELPDEPVEPVCTRRWAGGNAVVLKPASHDTPVTGGLLLAKISRAGPAGWLLSVLIGRGGEIGDYSWSIRAEVITFTGPLRWGGHRCENGRRQAHQTCGARAGRELPARGA